MKTYTSRIAKSAMRRKSLNPRPSGNENKTETKNEGLEESIKKRMDLMSRFNVKAIKNNPKRDCRILRNIRRIV